MMNLRLPALTILLLLTTAYYNCASTQKSVDVGQRLESHASNTNQPASTATGDSFTAADFEQHIARLKKQLPENKFTFVVQRPFVVIGDESPEVVKQRAAETVKWTVDLLKKDYFTRDPAHILNIWLFKNTASYQRYTRELFNDEPDTPYGYYSGTHRALIMNIETGSGTLVHEIVHPFIEANFPACPPWFNEGLASLYEQSGEVDGHLHGFPNWRLPALQETIRRGALVSFKSLLEMDADAFYRQDKGANYAQARYLCYYLQEKGLLVKFYREFTANQSADPSGYLSLQKILNETDMRAFQKRWEKFVLGLSEGYSVSVDSK
ncbi:MAG TPA: hypothetical protein VF528_06995 [Pyrinomonadaceae bacterium]|jgi:hypothetical protein